MKRLDYYIINQFIRNIVTIMAALIIIYLLIDFTQKYDDFIEKGKPISLALKFFLLNIPFILDQMGPVCILLAGVITLGILNHSNELIALKSCGIPLRRITTPIILSGAVCSLLLLSMSQLVLPKTTAATNHIWIQEVKERIPLGIYRNGRYYYKSKEGFFSFLRPSKDVDAFFYFSFASWDEKFHLTKLISAESAIWQNDAWLFAKGQVQTKTDEDTYQTEVFDQRRFDISENPSDFFVPEYRSKELSLTGLFLEAKRKETKTESTKAWSEFYGRISYTLLGLTLLLVGLPLLLIVYRRWGRDLSLAIPVSCGLAFVCWGLWGTQLSLAKAGYLNPFFAASSVHIIIGSIGIFLLLREDI